jgi:ribosomal protein L16 Arg81 hydroxylase
MKILLADGDGSIEQVESITQNEFEQHYFSKQKPVIIKRGVNQWKAVSLWSPDYFQSLYFDKEVSVHIYDEDKLPKLSKKYKMQDAINLICHNKSEEKYYLSQYSIHDEFKELINDFELPTWSNKNKEYISNLWFGQEGNETILHFDVSHNYLAQVIGRKHIRLFSPEDAPYLYSYPPESKKPTHYSQILDIDNPNYEVFPNFKYAKPIEGIISPGDVLFIPSGWWHDVRSLDLAVSVNFWWKPKPEECLMPHVLKNLAWHLYDNNSFTDIQRHNIDLRQFSNDLEVAKYLIIQDYRWLSVLFLWSFLENYIKNMAEKLNLLAKIDENMKTEAINNLIAKYNNNLALNTKVLINSLDILQLAKMQDNEVLSHKLIQNIIHEIDNYAYRVENLLRENLLK